ncbi:MAG: DMT family transporter [Cyanobacteria bacterium P01_H01_bin.15]
MSPPKSTLTTPALTVLTLIAFAANSILARMALETASIDAASFMTLRLSSGAIILTTIMALCKRNPVVPIQGKGIAAVMLFINFVTSAFSYLQLPVDTGALILFCSVQVTMILIALKQGEKPQLLEWIGLCLALAGLIYLVSPGLTAPPLVGSCLMVISGSTWGIYSLLGRSTKDPLSYTTANFVHAVPLAVGVSLVSFSEAHITPLGIILAILSGTLPSGVGCVIWYAALRGLTATRAATVQLAAPVIADIGGIIFFNEKSTWRLSLSSLLILGGIGLAIKGRKNPP